MKLATRRELQRGRILDPVRVCFLIDDLSLAGTETQLVRLIEHLRRDLVKPYLCLLRGGKDSLVLEPRTCPVLRLGVRSLHQPATVARVMKLARFFRRERIEVLQVYFPDSTYVGVTAARLAGVPHVVRVRNNLNHWMTPMHRLLGSVCNRLVSRTAANCEAARQAALADDYLPPRSVVVLENGVDLERFLQISTGSDSMCEGPRRVGIVANLRAVKGLDLFVQAAALLAERFPSVRFEIAGDGPERGRLEELLRGHGLLSRLLLRGVVRDIPGFLAGLDVAVLCSRSEGMSNALLEYMAAGRAIVATRVGAAPQLLEDGIHGVLVSPDNPPALANAMDRLLCDPDLCQRLGTAARSRARRQFSREAMCKRFESFFVSLARGSEGASWSGY
jgi:glycosyltransferase involved in cell wall biosynthesis